MILFCLVIFRRHDQDPLYADRNGAGTGQCVPCGSSMWVMTYAMCGSFLARKASSYYREQGTPLISFSKTWWKTLFLGILIFLPCHIFPIFPLFYAPIAMVYGDATLAVRLFFSGCLLYWFINRNQSKQSKQSKPSKQSKQPMCCDFIVAPVLVILKRVYNFILNTFCCNCCDNCCCNICRRASSFIPRPTNPNYKKGKRYNEKDDDGIDADSDYSDSHDKTRTSNHTYLIAAACVWFGGLILVGLCINPANVRSYSIHQPYGGTNAAESKLCTETETYLYGLPGAVRKKYQCQEDFRFWTLCKGEIAPMPGDDTYALCGTEGDAAFWKEYFGSIGIGCVLHFVCWWYARKRKSEGDVKEL